MSDVDAEPRYADPFTAMSEKIGRNTAADFAGAFVIVTPAGETHNMLLLDSSKNEAIFWGTIKTMVDMQLAELEDRERRGTGGFRR